MCLLQTSFLWKILVVCLVCQNLAFTKKTDCFKSNPSSFELLAFLRKSVATSVLTSEGFPKCFWPFAWLLWPPSYPFHSVNLASAHGRKTCLSYPFRISMDCWARLLTQQTWLKLEAHTRLQSIGNKPGNGDRDGASQILPPPWPRDQSCFSRCYLTECFLPHPQSCLLSRQGGPQELLSAQQTCASLSKEVHSSPIESLTTSLCPRWSIDRNKGKHFFFFFFHYRRKCLLREDRRRNSRLSLGE